ncbi:MAG: 2-C-methyl-D-erythritol 4-phosphate cytidylyltransferase [Armatimonadetes bacterium]|nr:2-C-methyl-D-erythritol 4-phosphate cytidylyltransferase [Armatimonadota bacterium]
MAQVAAVLAAAGAGVRFRENLTSASAADPRRTIPKTFLPLAGRPLWSHGARTLQDCEAVGAIAIVTPPEWVDEVRAISRRLGLSKVGHVVPGGARRQDSVENALRALAADPPELVAVHDGARPLASADLVARCIASARERGSGVAALPVTDTLKRADAQGQVQGTVDRQRLWAMQTPQVFSFTALLAAHEAAARDGVDVTDDAALIERLGETVWLVPGEAANLKITTPADLRLAESLWAASGGAPMRVGHGFDAHRLVPGRPCVLGGVTVPHDRGPLGHSDGDVLTHAVMDAALGALALGDLGRHFPDSDPAYRGARSVELAARVAELLREQGYRVANLDATLVAQAPKIAPHVPAMRAALAEAFGCEIEAVSVKGTTTEGLGFTGSGEGIAAHAVVVVQPLGGG